MTATELKVKLVGSKVDHKKDAMVLRRAVARILDTDWARENGRYDVAYAEMRSIAREALLEVNEARP